MENNFIEDRTKPPKADKPKDIKFPDYFDITTQDGINVLVIENHKIPIVTVRLVFRNAGSFHDGGKAGISQLTAELLTKGTITRKATDIAEEIDFIGASLHSGSDWDGSYLSLNLLKKHLNKGIEILADVIQNPVFEAEEIERLKEQRLSSIIQSKEDPSTLSDKIFNKVIYNNTPYEHPVEGTEDSLKNIDRENILSFYNEFLKPHNLIMAFVGDISPEEAVNIVTTKFIHWKLNPDKSELNNYDYSLNKSKEVHLVNKKGAVQSNIKIGHLGIKRNSKDFLGVSVLNMLLGGYFRSRINMNLREKNGYTYGAHSSFNSRLFAGDFSVETDVRNEVTLSAINEILFEMKRIIEEDICDEEMESVKNYMTGIFPLQLETANSVATRVINLKLYDLPKDYYNNYITNINILTAKDLKELAYKYIKPDNIQIIVTGNAEETKNDLEVLSKVNLYDHDLNLINK